LRLILTSPRGECTLPGALHDPGHCGSVGLPPMADSALSAENFIAAGIASLGIEADEVELAVMAAAHALFWPEIQNLLALDTGDLVPEPGPDLSRPPLS
jgi:hypothetical protein